MRVLPHPSGGVSQGDHSVLRLLRSVCFAVVSSPLAFVVAGTCVWLLVYLVHGVYHARTDGAEWGLSSALRCGGCFIALGLLACAAVGNIVVLFIVGWRGNKS